MRSVGLGPEVTKDFFPVVVRGAGFGDAALVSAFGARPMAGEVIPDDFLAAGMGIVSFLAGWVVFFAIEVVVFGDSAAFIFESAEVAGFDEVESLLATLVDDGEVLVPTIGLFASGLV